VIAARMTAEGEKTVALIRADGDEARFMPTAVSQDTQVRDLVAETIPAPFTS
jgi:hypothetical protein